MNVVAGRVVHGCWIGACLGLLAGCGGSSSSGDTGAAPAQVPVPGTLQLTATSYSIHEYETSVSIEVSRTGGSDGVLTATLTTANATATAGEDYVAVSSTVTFAAGDTAAKTIELQLIDDALTEPNETFTVTLTTSATTPSSTATVTIQDDDVPGTLHLGRATYSIGEGGGNVAIDVRRSGGRSGVVSASLATQSGTATAGADFSETATVVSFADGDDSVQTILIPITNDPDAELDETFTVALSDAAGGAVLGEPATATITITANDQPVTPPSGGAPGSLQLNAATFDFAESAGNAVITVTRVGGSGGAVSARLTTTAGTALAGQDFTAANVLVNFAAGDLSSKTVMIPIVADSIAEEGESFSVALSSPTGGATIGTPSSAIVQIQDDDPPAVPVLSFTAATKRLDFTWPAVPTATAYKLFFNPDGVSGFTQVGADLPATELSATFDLSVHTFNWQTALFRLEACNAVSCRGSAAVNPLSGMLPAIGYFKASGLDAIDAGDLFGASVALSGDGSRLAVGASGEDSNAVGIGGNPANDARLNSGAVYVFVRVDGAWQQEAYIKASDPTVNANFGIDVALNEDGTALAIGAYSAGKAYVFRRTATLWAQQGAAIVGPNTEQADLFGVSVALSRDGGTLAIGALTESNSLAGVTNGPGGPPSDDNNALAAGAAYVYAFAGGAWQLQSYLKPAVVRAQMNFGSDVSLSGDGSTLAVGAVSESGAATTVNGDQNDSSAADAGAAYIFVRNGAAWSQQAYLKVPNAEPYDGFGWRLSLSSDGNTVAVAALSEDGIESEPLAFPLPPPPTATPPTMTFEEACRSGTPPPVGCQSGAVYVFARNGTTWTAEAYLKASNNPAGAAFGQSLGLSADGHSLLVGSMHESSSAVGMDGDQALTNAARAGAAYLFERSGTTWSQRSYIKASNSNAGDEFGTDVAMSDDASTLAIGAPAEDGATTTNQNDNASLSAGAVYLY